MARDYSVTRLKTIAENYDELVRLAESGCYGFQNTINHQDWRRITEEKVDFDRALVATRRKVKFDIMNYDGSQFLEVIDYRIMAGYLNRRGKWNVWYKRIYRAR